MSAVLETAMRQVYPDRAAECRRHDVAMRKVNRAARMVTTRAGITIGIAYQPRPSVPGLHAEQIQRALLEPRTATPATGLRRVLGALWRWA